MEIGNTVVTLHGHKLAVGMAWKALPGISSTAREIAALCNESGVRFGAVVTTDDATLVGLHNSTAKVAAGAAWVAEGSKGDAIVLLEPIGDDLCWICAVRNGAPQPSFDLVVSNTEIAGVLKRLSAFGEFKTLSKEYEGANESIDFLDLTEGKKPKYLKQITGVQREVKVIGAAAVCVVLAGFLFVHYSRQQAQQNAQITVDRINASQEETRKREAEIRRVNEIAAAELQVRLAVSAAPSTLGAISAWLDAVENLPITVAGWNLGSIHCTATNCIVTWKRTRYGTTETFLSAAADAGWKVGSYFVDTAETTIAVAAAARSGNPKEIPAEAAVMPELLTALQSIDLAGVTFSIKRPEQPLGVVTNTEPVGAQLKESPWKIGKFTLAGKHLFEVHDVPEYLDRDNVSLAAFDFDAASNIWNLEGSYAVK